MGDGAGDPRRPGVRWPTSPGEAAALAGELPGRDACPVRPKPPSTAFMARYGMRGLAEIDLGRPRWREEPGPSCRRSAELPRRSRTRSRRPMWCSRGARAAAEAAIERLVEAAARDTRRLAQGAAGALGGAPDARPGRAARERPSSAWSALGIVRAALLDSGARPGRGRRAGPARRPVLSAPGANWKPWRRARMRDWRGPGPRSGAQAYAREKRRRQIPRLLLSDGQAFYEGVAASDDAGTGVLAGSPVSPGVVEGVVRVVLDPRSAQLAPGEILVCPGTDPAWTPLFLAAGGLVMEVGGLMTHGSVVAREYGIPAVVGVHEATTRLQTGQRVRVDGTAGRVEVL